MSRPLPQETSGAISPLLLAALKSAEVGVAVKDTEGGYLHIGGLPDYFPPIGSIDATDELLFGAEWLDEVQSAQRAVLGGQDKVSVNLTRTTNSEFCSCECTLQRYQLNGAKPAILITFVDLTPERKREDALKALLRELSHRSKNLLAIVQSIAAQTARTSENLELFLTKFRGRIAALSSAQDLVTDSNWRGANFSELAARQFARYLDADDERIQVVGDDIVLSPNGATHVGLALHELIVNATTYGALAHDDGRIVLSCRLIEENGEMFADMRWEESSTSSVGREDQESADRRFGSTVLERVVPAAMEGESWYAIAPHHIDYQLRFPLQ